MVIQFPIDHSKPFPRFFECRSNVIDKYQNMPKQIFYIFAFSFWNLSQIVGAFLFLVIFFTDRPKRPSSSSIFRLPSAHSLMSFHLVGRPVLMMFLRARGLCVCLCFRWRILSTTSKSENTPKIGKKEVEVGKENIGKHLLFSLHKLEERTEETNGKQRLNMGRKGHSSMQGAHSCLTISWISAAISHARRKWQRPNTFHLLPKCFPLRPSLNSYPQVKIMCT